MNPELSRRAARVVHMPSFLERNDREEFIEAVCAAKDFDSLPAKWREEMIRTEKEIAELLKELGVK